MRLTIPSASDPRHHAPCLSLAAGTCCSTSRDATSDNSMAVQCAAATRTPSPPCHAPVAISFKGTPFPLIQETAATCADDRWHPYKACAVHMAGVTGTSAAAALHARALPASLRTPPRVSCSMRTCRATMRMTCCAIFRCSHSAVARAHTHTHCSHSAVALALRLFGVKSALC